MGMCNDSAEKPKAVVSILKGQDDHPRKFHMRIPRVLLQN